MGATVAPDDLIIVVMAYVADTDEQAVREARPHIEKFFSLVPPRHAAVPRPARLRDDAASSCAARPTRALAHSTEATWDDMVNIGRIACGSPDTVADTIVAWCEEAGAGRVNVVFENGDMPEWKTVKNMTMFAEEVIPRIRARLRPREKRRARRERRADGRLPGGPLRDRTASTPPCSAPARGRRSSSSTAAGRRPASTRCSRWPSDSG